LFKIVQIQLNLPLLWLNFYHY